jgi:20S proteasome alpha/beta subunit
MTYILGSVCTDGVVLVADRKIMLEGGTVHEFEDKLTAVQPWMVVGSSGVLGLFEKFRERLYAYLQSSEYDNSVPTLISQIETITRELNTAYGEVLRGQVFDVLLGIQSTMDASLKYVYPSGFAEGVRRYKVIGHGESYGSLLLKYWWHKNMSMLEVAELGFLIIKCIQEFEVDNTVGIGEGYPQIWLVPRPKHTKRESVKAKAVAAPHSLTESELLDLQAKVVKRLAKFKREELG